MREIEHPIFETRTHSVFCSTRQMNHKVQIRNFQSVGFSIDSRLALSLLILVLPFGAWAMDLPHHDLESLVYLSTDIVLADISKDEKGAFTATVKEPLYGSLQVGVKLDGLTPFLA